MDIIDLQKKTSAEKGNIEIFWFENEKIGLKKKLYHRINIPLKPFDSGLASDAKPVKTKIVMDWLDLNLKDPMNLDGLNLKSNQEDDRDISVYIGGAHNPCDIRHMKITKLDDNTYDVNCSLFVEFEFEKVAKNEGFKFKTQIELDRKITG